jgi:hypothetical protein
MCLVYVSRYIIIHLNMNIKSNNKNKYQFGMKGVFI